MNIVESYLNELLARLDLHGTADCPVCNMRRYAAVIYSRPIEIDEVQHEYDLLELSCKECGNTRTFNLEYFNSDGGVYAKSVTQDV